MRRSRGRRSRRRSRRSPIPSSTLPNGMIASAATPQKITSTGPSDHRNGTAAVGRVVLLRDQLQRVGERLEQAVGADAIGAVARLEAAQELALDHGQDRHDREDHREDHDALTIRIQVASTKPDLGDRQRHEFPSAALTSTTSAPGQQVGVVLGRPLDQEPGSRPHPLAHRDPRLDAVAVAADDDRLPCSTPSRSASAGASSRVWCGVRNCSAGLRSVTSPDQRSR